MASPVLEVSDLTKRFGNQVALNGVSFTVGEGEVVALLGDNGAGKSTLVKCIAGIYRPDDGQLLVDGERLQGGSPAEARTRGIGIVYQDLALLDNMSIAENLFAGSEPCWPRRLGGLGIVKKRAMLEEARRTLQRLEVNIPNPRTAVGLLSGGQRQAIAVSKGVAFARKLVVLDEPTAALGLRERGNVLRLVQRLPEHGVAVILITHNLEEVMAVATRAVILRQGNKVGELAAIEANHQAIVSMIVGGHTPTTNGRVVQESQSGGKVK